MLRRKDNRGLPMTAKRPLIVVPTYNEKENLPRLIEAVRDAMPIASILIVDDNSPDGTGAIAFGAANIGVGDRRIGGAQIDTDDILRLLRPSHVNLLLVLFEANIEFEIPRAMAATLDAREEQCSDLGHFRAKEQDEGAFQA